MSSQPHKEQLVKVSSKAGTARKLKNQQEDEEEDWQKEDHLEVQWAEDEKLEEVLERRRVEGSSLQAEIMQKGV